MKLLASWLRELADVRLPAADLASLLSMRGFEVASIEPVGRAEALPHRDGDLSGTAEAPPHRDRDLSGTAEAPPHRDRDLSGTAEAPPHRDRDLSGTAEALPHRDRDLSGTAEALPHRDGTQRPAPQDNGGAGLQPCPDAVIDFEITANRPDCLSVAGLAREAATACGVALRLPWDEAGRPISTVRPPSAPTASRLAAGGLEVTIEDSDLCPRYAAAVAEVRVGPSPAWIADRLTAAGVRPINSVVDVTNYVLLEMGHPLHAFDLERLAGRQLRARPARAGERIRTLDGEDRALDAGMLVIADAAAPQAVAGVMGGASSEVSATTRLIAFESAYFQPASVRRTSRRLGLKSEASSRFERGTDISAPVVALERACALLERIGAGRRTGDVIDVYPAPRGPIEVLLRRDRIARLLGTTVDDAEVARIFAGLGFDATVTEDGWRVRVPTMRVDVQREADLIEEVARHHGYELVPSHFPPLRAPSAQPEAQIARKSLLRHALAAAGFSEAVTYSFTGAADAAPYTDPGQPPVPLAYPLSEKFAVLRPSLLPGLVESVAHNRRHDMRDVRLFEIGACFSPASGERHRVAIVLTGAGVADDWSGGYRAADFFDAKGVVETIGEALRLPVTFAETAAPYLRAGFAAACAVGSATIGVVGQLLPALAEARGLSGADGIFVAEIDLDAVGRLAPAGDAHVKPLPRFPSIVRDISIVVGEGVRSDRIRETIRAAAPATLTSVREFNRYKGKGIPDGRYSLSLRLTFRSPERTLTDADALAAMEGIMEALVRSHQAVQR